MEEKNQFWKGVLTGTLVTAGLGIVVTMGAGLFALKTFFEKPVITIENGQVSTGQTEEEEQKGTLPLEAIKDKMEYIQTIVDQYFLFEEDSQKVEDMIYSGMMYGLGDPYSVYYTEDNYKSMKESVTGEYCGIGAMVSQNRTTGVITVTRVFKSAPAAEAGMKDGDILYKIEDMDATGQDLDILVSNYIRGEENTDVHVTVLRGEAMDEVELTITRRKVEVPTVEYQMLDNHVGYVELMQFEETSSGQFVKAVEELESQGMEKLVIDLRDNPGGVLDTAVEIMAYLLPDDKMGGRLVTTADKNGKGDQYVSKSGKVIHRSDFGYKDKRYPYKDEHEVTVPYAILVNGNSASASEVLTGAVLDYESGIVVGTNTFGKGIVQSLIPLGDGTALKLTTAHYYTPSGYDLHGVGLEPNIVVEADPESLGDKKTDNQLQAAIKALEEVSK